MAGTIKASTITDGTYSAGTDELIRGSHKAWILLDGTTASPTIKSQFNVSSITDTGVGVHTLNFIKPMASLNYGIVGSTVADAANNAVTLNVALTGGYQSGPTNKTLSSCAVIVGNGNGAYDSKEVFIAVIGG